MSFMLKAFLRCVKQLWVHSNAKSRFMASNTILARYERNPSGALQHRTENVRSLRYRKVSWTLPKVLRLSLCG
jgi:hypothetical protein